MLTKVTHGKLSMREHGMFKQIAFYYLCFFRWGFCFDHRLFGCLYISRITQKVLGGFSWYLESR